MAGAPRLSLKVTTYQTFFLKTDFRLVICRNHVYTFTCMWASKKYSEAFEETPSIGRGSLQTFLQPNDERLDSAAAQALGYGALFAGRQCIKEDATKEWIVSQEETYFWKAKKTKRNLQSTVLDCWGLFCICVFSWVRMLDLHPNVDNSLDRGLSRTQLQLRACKKLGTDGCSQYTSEDPCN